MGLETGNFIADLDATNPLPEDGKDQGDDHIRLLKSALKNSIAGFPGAVFVGGQDTGVSNTYVLTSPLRAYSVNMTVLWLPANTNGGASTINIAGLGAQPIRRIDGTPLENGDIMAGNPVAMLYTGTQFRLTAITKRYVDNLISSGVLPGQTGNAGKPLITDGTNAAFSNAFGVAMDEAEGAPIAAGSTVNLTSGAGTGNFTHITGSGFTINLMTLPGGAERTLVFDGTGTLVNGANLILPTNANIAVQAGDTLRVRGEGAGVSRVVGYMRANGRALAEQLPPGWVLLAPSVAAVAGVSVIDFLNVFSSTYDDYEIIVSGLTGVPNSTSFNNSQISLQFAVGGIVDSNNAYTTGNVNDTTGAAISSSFRTGIQITVNSSVSGSASGSIRIQNANAQERFIYSLGFTRVAGGAGTNSYAAATAGLHSNSGAASGIRLSLSTGVTFGAGGSIKIYGIRKT